MWRDAPAEHSDETSLDPLSPHLVDDVSTTVEDLRRRLHRAAPTLNDAMREAYIRQWRRQTPFAAASPDGKSYASFFPVATAPVDCLPVPLLTTLLPRFASATAPESRADGEKPRWDASTQVETSARRPVTSEKCTRPGPSTRRRVKVVLPPQEDANPPCHHTDPSSDPPRTTARAYSRGNVGATASPAAHAHTTNRSLSDSQLAVVQEQELAVRDYLRRMNIIGAAPSPDDSESVLCDPLYNGSAVVRLAQCIANLTHHNADSATSPRSLRVWTVQDAARNYSLFHQILSSREGDDRELHKQRKPPLVPPTILAAVTVEACVVEGDPRPLLTLVVHLIANHLPPPEELPFAAPELSSQPPADMGSLTWPHTAAGDLTSGDALWRAERDVCGLLFTYAALPAPEVHMLPGDDCVVPGPLAAPFLASHDGRLFTARFTEPAALYVPSVFPYLCNGVALVALAQQCVPDGLRVSASAATGPSIHSNPRTRSSCLANIQWAVDRLQRLFSGPSAFQDAFVAEMVFRGYRSGIVALLSSVFHCLRRRKLRGTGPVPLAVGSATHTATERSADYSRTSSPHHNLAASSVEDQTVEVPTSDPDAHQAELNVSDAQRWLVRVLRPDKLYVAEDGEFSMADLLSNAWNEPCHVFSDGVLLSRLLSRLERRRCPSLDRVRPTTKTAAKRFNIGQCLAFLEAEKGVSLEVTRVVEGLLTGSVETLEHVIQTLRQVYTGV